jgi:hypothetical protein
VLFGEWLAARHTMPYDCLPDWFLAFDVLDSHAQRFLSRQAVAGGRGNGQLTLQGQLEGAGLLDDHFVQGNASHCSAARLDDVAHPC